jgi:hypothetical protein
MLLNKVLSQAAAVLQQVCNVYMVEVLGRETQFSP